jgi:hypothetical protein
MFWIFNQQQTQPKAAAGAKKANVHRIHVPELINSFGSGSGTLTESIWVPENKNSLTARRSFLDFLPSMVCDFTAIDRVYRAIFIFPAVGDRNPVLGTFRQSEANRHNASWTQ